MHLKSLTLKGFKSFASSTTLRFEPGITCVVGPNGSGKSNVVDALTWVMGEQGAKALRGGKMDDVIFAGTSGRSPLGRAEVTLTIDNADGALPIEYSEVSITRRVYREGGGEYEINGSSCRLMDVQELLSDTGIGREMHVIVGQGRITGILESRPEERRAFIEEAAGVLKHRRRKEKAVRKLDSMQANLSRLTDLTTELRRQLKPLGRQAEVARRAQTVQADLRDARLRLAADDLVARRTEMEQGAAQEAELRAQLESAQAEQDDAAGRLAEDEEALARLEPEAKAAQQSWFRLSALAERVDATVRIAHDRASTLATEQQQSPGRDPDELDRQAERAAEEEAELEQSVESAAEVLDAAREALDEREQVAAEADRAHVAAVRAVADRREGLARLVGEVNTLRSRTESVDAEVTRLTEAMVQAQERAVSAHREFEQAQAQADELEGDEAALDEHHERAAAAFEAAEARVAELRAGEREAEQKVVSLRARIEALEMSLARKDGAAWLLERAGLGDGSAAEPGAAQASADGVVGRLAERMRVRAGYERAIAAALGPAAEAVAMRDAGSAAEAIAALKEGDAGRAALITTVAGESAPGVDGGAPAGGALWAESLVDVDGDLGAAVRSLLSRVAVVDDLETAFRTVEASPGVRVATRDGDLVGHGWSVGGSESATSMLEVQAAVDEAGEAAVAAAARAEELAAALAGAVAEEDVRRENAEVTLAALTESDASMSAVYEQLGRLGQSARAAEAEHGRLSRQRQEAEAGREDTVAALTGLEERLRLAEKSIPGDDEQEAGDGALAEARDDAVAAVSEARAIEVEARLGLRTAEERAAALRGRADSLRRSAAAERQARERAERARLRRRKAAAVASVVAEMGEKVAERLAAEVSSAAQGRDDLEAQRVERSERVRETRGRVTELTQSLHTLTDAAHRDEMARAKIALRIEQLEEQILEQNGMAPDDLVAEYGPHIALPPSELEMAEYEQARERGEQVVAPAPMPFDRATQIRRAKQAEKDLRTLGKVNPLALEEFAAMEERYSFLATQLEDVKKARQDLLDVVDEVDARILQVFTEAYADVEREFVDVFATLFPGGEGRLVLTDPNDMLTTGVEVEARPPGKKVKRLSLLSGGEKSLTAVAMLVAIFRARPSPFYVMDEVEAALDEVNLNRLISLFTQLRERSQLIVITHQKSTMEIADALYGVSMRGDGITQVISQRMRGVDLGDVPVTD
ncbi:chromosome segregation protein SMC [Tomitella fengzijianii]|uniref:Chromosome partition protein Smc n=1 Tax=Tomitella fengzijianii TaxID=2597660 RepID=A0A516X3R8_9ACTN|nr:chromosome segregation protein SMC [Tomitella fengzijianii]QDQ97707.1 chromosome segregation protein SMC [Tomitella fengzijianii]